MAILTQDIILDENAFYTASQDMEQLKKDAANLKKKLQQMYKDVTTALDTTAGKEIDLTAQNVLLEPIENMSVVIKHISKTLDTIIGSGYYKDIFVKYEELNK